MYYFDEATSEWIEFPVYVNLKDGGEIPERIVSLDLSLSLREGQKYRLQSDDYEFNAGWRAGGFDVDRGSAVYRSTLDSDHSETT